MSDHVVGNCYGSEFFSIVYLDELSDHVWKNDHVSAVSFNWFFMFALVDCLDHGEEFFLFWSGSSFEASALS